MIILSKVYHIYNLGIRNILKKYFILTKQCKYFCSGLGTKSGQTNKTDKIPVNIDVELKIYFVCKMQNYHEKILPHAFQNVF